MHKLRMLGGIGLSTTDGSEVDGLLRQPKRIALLAYLALPKPGTWHRRDTLLLLFSPDLDQVRARTALRSALHTLRRHLPDGAIQTRGDDEVSLDPQFLETDVAAMMSDIAAGRHEEALARYTGDLLPALHIGDSPGFEKWLEAERGRLKGIARKAAGILADNRKKDGDLAGAIAAAQRATELDAEDETAIRRLIDLLDQSGDRAQAFAVYQRFRNHLADELGIRPSAETVALVDAVRTRHTINASVVAPSDPPPEMLPVVRPTASAEIPPAGEDRVLSDRTLISARSRWVLGLVAAAIVLIVLLARSVWGPGTDRANSSSPVGRRLVVMPTENDTGDSSLDYVGSGIAEGIARRLKGLGNLTIQSGARSEWPSAVRHDYRTIGREFGSTVLLRTTLSRVGDSLEIRVSAIDAATSGERSVGSRRFATSQLRDVESSLAAAVAGVLFRVPLPADPRPASRKIDSESYRLMLEGWHQFLTLGNRLRGRALFDEAIRIDPRNSRAWSGLSSTWANETLSGTIPFEIGYDRSSAAAERALALDSLEGTAWANLGFMRALKYGSLAIGLELIEKAIASEPGNPEIFLIQSSLYRYAHKWEKAIDAVRVAQALDPLSTRYAEREAFADLCADSAAIALRIFESQLRVNPSDKSLQVGLVRSLSRLGRYDEAISAWKTHADASGDSALSHALAGAKGKSGYWGVMHAEGRKRLAALKKEPGFPFADDSRAMRESFASGDFEAGYRLLNSTQLRRRTYQLPCLPSVDEVRETERFKSVLATIGPMPER